MAQDDGAMIKKMTEHAIRLRLRKAVRLITEVSTKVKKNVESIHQLRSETRRADAVLRLFIDWLPSRRAERIQQELKEVRKKAGCVRDMDVVMPLLKALNHQLPRKAIEWLLERAESLRSKRMHLLKRHCRKLLRRSFKDRSRSLAHDVRWRQETTVPNPRKACQLAIDHLAKDFFSAVGLLNDDAEQLHKARILGRRLRYTLDLLRDFLPDSPIEKACQKLTEVQDILGTANDRESTLTFLQMCSSEPDEMPASTSLLQVIDTLEAETAEQRNSVVRGVIESVKDVQSLLAEFVSRA